MQIIRIQINLIQTLLLICVWIFHLLASYCHDCSPANSTSGWAFFYSIHLLLLRLSGRLPLVNSIENNHQPVIQHFIEEGIMGCWFRSIAIDREYEILYISRFIYLQFRKTFIHIRFNNNKAIYHIIMHFYPKILRSR